MTTEKTNVISIEKKRSLLPLELEALIIAQYTVSHKRNETAEEFMTGLESKLSSWALQSVVEAASSAFKHLRSK